MNQEPERLSQPPLLSETNAASNGTPAASASTTASTSSAIASTTEGVAVALEAVRVDADGGRGGQAVITFVPSSGAGGSDSQVSETLLLRTACLRAYCYTPGIGHQQQRWAVPQAASAAAAAVAKLVSMF